MTGCISKRQDFNVQGFVKKFHVDHTNAVIYCFTHVDSGKKYIGSTINCVRRIREHLYDLKTSKHANKHLLSYWHKYGNTKFNIEILETIVSTNFNNRKEISSYLQEREFVWISYYQSSNKEKGFNLVADPRLSGLAGYKHTEESKKKMSISVKNSQYCNSLKHKETSRVNITLANTLEARLKAKQNRPSVFGANNPFYGKFHTEETKHKMKIGRKNININGVNNPNYNNKWNDIQKLNASINLKNRKFITGKKYIVMYTPFGDESLTEYHIIYNMTKYIELRNMSKSIQPSFCLRKSYLNNQYILIDKKSTKIGKNLSAVGYIILKTREEAEAKFIDDDLNG
jgi:group I intron endonuclease